MADKPQNDVASCKQHLQSLIEMKSKEQQQYKTRLKQIDDLEMKLIQTEIQRIKQHYNEARDKLHDDSQKNICDIVKEIGKIEYEIQQLEDGNNIKNTSSTPTQLSVDSNTTPGNTIATDQHIQTQSSIDSITKSVTTTASKTVNKPSFTALTPKESNEHQVIVSDCIITNISQKPSQTLSSKHRSVTASKSTSKSSLSQSSLSQSSLSQSSLSQSSEKVIESMESTIYAKQSKNKQRRQVSKSIIRNRISTNNINNSSFSKSLSEIRYSKRKDTESSLSQPISSRHESNHNKRKHRKTYVSEDEDNNNDIDMLPIANDIINDDDGTESEESESDQARIRIRIKRGRARGQRQKILESSLSQPSATTNRHFKGHPSSHKRKAYHSDDSDNEPRKKRRKYNSNSNNKKYNREEDEENDDDEEEEEEDSDYYEPNESELESTSDNASSYQQDDEESDDESEHNENEDDDESAESLTAIVSERNSNKSKVKPKTKKKSATMIPLDKAIETLDFGAARQKAWNNRLKNPNAFYYRFNAPRIVRDNKEQQKLCKQQKNHHGGWKNEEHKLFMERVKELGVNYKWGEFSKIIPGRVGYACSNYWSKMIKDGDVIDLNYGRRKDKQLGKNKRELVFKWSTSRNNKSAEFERMKRYSFTVINDRAGVFANLPQKHNKHLSDDKYRILEKKYEENYSPWYKGLLEENKNCK